MNVQPGSHLLEYEEYIFAGAMLSYLFWQYGPCSVTLCVREMFLQVLRLCLESYGVLLQVLFVWAPAKGFISLLKSKKSARA